MTSPSFARRGLFLAALLAAAGLAACKGDNALVSGCSTDQDCKDSHNGDASWICDKTQTPAVCTQVHVVRACDTANDCCPAQICNQQGHFCNDKYTPCTGPGSCTTAGQVCKTIGVFSSGLGCTFEKCGAGDSCADGTTCFNHYCVGEPPCQGGCALGKVCTTVTNLCSAAPADVSCQRSCPAGQELVLTNPDNIFDSCQPAANTCLCASLPPLAIHDLGRHSSSAVSGGNLYVSTYDGEHGDLVLLTFDKTNPVKPTKAEWLDGVPATGHIGGDLNGPRHGITDNGQNVGQYTSIAADAGGNLYISYYDVDNGDLKFMGRYNGTWTQPMTVDGSNAASGAPTGDVGLYSSLALTSGNVPAIAYFRRGTYDATAQAETGLSTALVYAVAKTAQPQNRGDWIVVGDVEALNKPTPPCGAGCPSGQLCVDEGGSQSRCARPAASSAPCPVACTGTQACVVSADGASSVCRSSLAAQTLTDLPPGVGVTPALAFIDDKAVIAYYDSVGKTLKGVQATAGGATPAFGAPVIIDGADASPAIKRDVGRFPSIAVGKTGQVGGRIAIGFQDLTSQQFLLFQSDSLSAHASHTGAGALIHVLDSGRPNQDDANEAWHAQTFPGAQSSIAFTPSGQVAAVFQDTTPVDLRFATYNPSAKTATRSTLRATGAAGFWPHVAMDGGTAIVTSAVIQAATAQVSGNKLVVDTKAAP